MGTRVVYFHWHCENIRQRKHFATRANVLKSLVWKFNRLIIYINLSCITSISFIVEGALRDREGSTKGGRLRRTRFDSRVICANYTMSCSAQFKELANVSMGRGEELGKARRTADLSPKPRPYHLCDPTCHVSYCSTAPWSMVGRNFGWKPSRRATASSC